MVIENGNLRVEFDSRGTITSLFSKRLNKELLIERTTGNLFRLMIPEDSWDGRHIDSSEQKYVRIIKKSDTVIVIEFDRLHVGQMIFPITVSVSARIEGEDLIMSLEIHNESDEQISDVIFPMISGFGKNLEDYSLIMPTQFRNRVLKSPLRNIGDDNHLTWNHMNHKLFLRYPQWLVSSWVDYSNGKDGFSLDIRNSESELFDFCVEKLIYRDAEDSCKNSHSLQMALAFYPNLGHGESWKSCEFIFSVHDGDWHVVADRHRKWLEKFIMKPDVCDAFRNSLGWTFYFMKHQDGTIVRRYGDLEKIAVDTVEAGLKYSMIFGWQQKGHDNYYSFGYYPNEEWGGKAALKTNLEAARKIGCEIIPFFNGTLLDVKTAEYTEYGHRWPVIGRTGNPYSGGDASRTIFDIPFRNAAMATSSRNMMLYDLCFTGIEASKWFLESVRRIVSDYEFNNIQLDQIGHKSYACYDKAHGHARPEKAFTDELKALLLNVRRLVRSSSKNSVVISEGFSDVVSQFCDASWNWQQMENPEVVRYSLPWILYSHETDALEYGKVNDCFAHGILLDLKIDGGDGSIGSYPKFRDHVKALAELKPKSKSYVYGDFRDEEGIEYTRNDGIIMKSYSHATEGWAVVAANTTPTEKRADFTCNLFQGQANSYYSYGASSLEKMNGVKKLNLKPYEVVIFTEQKTRKNDAGY